MFIGGVDLVVLVDLMLSFMFILLLMRGFDEWEKARLDKEFGGGREEIQGL